MHETNTIGQVLDRHLGRVAAPEALWTRVENRIDRTPARRSATPSRKLIWALAAAIVFGGIAWNLPRPEFQSDDPGQIRAWVKQQTGLDLPLAAHPRSAHLTGVRMKKGGVEIAYRTGARTAAVAVTRAAAGETAHWSSGGQSYVLACALPADLDSTCQLCHSGTELN